MNYIPTPTPARLRETLLAGTENTEQAVEAAIYVYREAKAQAELAAVVWTDVADEAKAKLTEIIEETGVMTWKTNSGSAYIPAASKTVSYDAKALDALCASSAELAAILRPHRIEKERAGSLTIR